MASVSMASFDELQHLCRVSLPRLALTESCPATPLGFSPRLPLHSEPTTDNAQLFYPTRNGRQLVSALKPML